MDKILLNEIIEGLRPVRPRQARRIERLFNAYNKEKDHATKRKIRSTIHDLVYFVMGKCVDKDSRYILENYPQMIAEGNRNIERKAGDGWVLGYTGAVRFANVDGKTVITNYVPREYGKGFYLDTPTTLSKEAKLREAHFYLEQSDRLAFLAKDMDRRQEVISGKYEPVSPEISRELIEKMIDFLGLTRIKDQEKVNQEVKQKIKS